MRKIILLMLVLVSSFTFPVVGRADSVIELLDRTGEVRTTLTDGDLISLRLRLDAPAARESQVQFTLQDASAVMAACTIPAGQKECTTPAFAAYGWYWGSLVRDASQPYPTRQVFASLDGLPALPESLTLSLQPRPVVLVHGFISNYTTWTSYLGPQGFLALVGLPGYAVGDGQVEGVLNTGNIAEPTSPTNTVAQNAAILAAYIRNVKAQTGAEQVDLVGHSMGGLISRYYIDRLMDERDVAQLIMLGTPSSGADCAVLPAALGFYYPTVLEIRSSYMTQVFNQQIKHRNGVPFYALAGTRITSPVGSPCTDTPNDMVVSVSSVSSINLEFTETPILHVDMNTSLTAFQDFVLPRLLRSPEASWQEADPPALAPAGVPVQFSRVYSGHINPGESTDQTIQLEPGLVVANFALFDPSQSLAVTVTGASGKEIVLDAEKNGLMVIDDPSTLVHMGYGFADPKPGPWKIRLSATGRTPASGADYALTANLVGGAELTAAALPLLPQTGEAVQISARLTLSGSALEIQQAEATVRSVTGAIEPLSVTIKGDQIQGTWQPTKPGFYAIDLRVTALHPDGSGAPIERTAYLTVEAQPGAGNLLDKFGPTWLLVSGLCFVSAILLVVLLVAGARWITRSIKQQKG